MSNNNNEKSKVFRYFSQAKDNKLVVYLVTRYLTYFIQFLTSLLLANKLGPTSYGIWGYILLLISYFGMINFGLGNSMSVILVQNKDNNDLQNEYIKNDLFLVSSLGLIIVGIMLAYGMSGMNWFSRYSLTYEFFIICIIAILTHFDNNFTNIFRVKNDFYRIAFCQSCTPFLLFICTLVFEGEALLQALLYSTLLGSVLSLIIFLYKTPFKLSGHISFGKSIHILSKGWWLFLYNLFFYFILISTRTFISKYYTVEDFGFFSFSFTLGDAVLLLFQAASNIVFPKVLSRLGGSVDGKRGTIELIDDTYVTMVYLAVFVVCCLFPFILLLFPQYSTCCTCMSLVALTMALYTNAYAHTSYLMSNNKEKLLVLIAFVSLVFNVLVSLFLIKVLRLEYSYIILSTFCSYYLFYALCALAVQKDSGEKQRIFNWRLHIPTIIALILSLFGGNIYIIFVIVIFLLINKKNLKNTFSIMRAVWRDYRVINV